MTTVADVVARLEARGANHDLSVSDLLEKIPPEVVDNHQEVNDWLNEKQVSHIKPVSTHPHLKNDPDNWVWEDSSTNMARGNEEMTELELQYNVTDNQLDASLIDGDPHDSPDPEWVDVLIENDIPLDVTEPPVFQMF